MAKPLNPPEAIAFGNKNKLNAIATIAEPLKTSSTFMSDRAEPCAGSRRFFRFIQTLHFHLQKPGCLP
ncbi:hypothetical protein [Salicibibacter halophilus]|uniref:hypothetical protein n=1 Tax=Salicibibacter halophilus TaxID=2502791 RepID=UPI001D04D134|nr:hypothetical protein [Salicibibacter halophilus]